MPRGCPSGAFQEGCRWPHFCTNPRMVLYSGIPRGSFVRPIPQIELVTMTDDSESAEVFAGGKVQFKSMYEPDGLAWISHVMSCGVKMMEIRTRHHNIHV